MCGRSPPQFAELLIWIESDAPRCAICVFQAPEKAEKKEAVKEEEKPKADGVKAGL